MQESLLHYVWQCQYFDHANLISATNESIVVLEPGHRNTNSGPDFSNARIKIDNIEWIGNVEIHIYSSGWIAHKHQMDPAYENVILHVVWENDVPIRRRDSSAIPTIELKSRVSQDLLLRYKNLYLNPENIACANSIRDVSNLTIVSAMERSMASRLQSKAESVLEVYRSNHEHWDETCYQLLARNFGFKINSDPFFMLARSLPYKVIMKHADKPLQIEALLFGQAGFLEEDYGDEYYGILKREFRLLSQKFSLLERRLTRSQWKLLRLRPANFPTIRIAQLAALIEKHKLLFSKFIEAQTYKELVAILDIDQSSYWKTHYTFFNKVDAEIPGLGQMSINNIIINTVVPILAAYGKLKDEQQFMDRAVSILESITAEKNMITRTWESLGVQSTTASDSQALIELYNNFCLRKRCLDCNIGSALIRPILHDYS